MSGSSRRNTIVMTLGWWYLRRQIRKRGAAAVAGLVAGHGLSFASAPPRKRHPLRWLLLLGLVAGGGFVLWKRRQGGGGGEDWGSWEPGPPVDPTPSEYAPVPEPTLQPEPVAT